MLIIMMYLIDLHNLGLVNLHFNLIFISKLFCNFFIPLCSHLSSGFLRGPSSLPPRPGGLPAATRCCWGPRGAGARRSSSSPPFCRTSASTPSGGTGPSYPGGGGRGSARVRALWETASPGVVKKGPGQG